MQIVTKNIIAGILTAGFLGFFVWQSYQKPAPQEAQAKWDILTVYDGMVCDQPIPLGRTTAETQKLIGDLQDYYDQTRTILDGSIQKITAIVGALNENQQSVCDFTKCKADVTDKGVDAAITLDMFIAGSVSLEAHAANCQVEPAKGNPCPDIAELAKGLEADKAGLALYHQQVKEIFENPTIPLPDDLKKPGDNKFQKITLPELIMRNAELSEAWFTPAGESSLKKTCALTLEEQRKVAKEEMGNVAPAKCVEAVEKGWYWPKASSPFCESACKDGLTEPCRNCLAIDPGEHASVLAKVNYRIFGTCKDTCVDDLNNACQRCICSRDDGSLMTEGECLDLLCGERENYVCCHENPLDIKYYIADGTEARAGSGQSFLADFSSYSPPTFYAGKLTTSGKGVGLGDLAVDTSVIPLGACIKIDSVVDLDTPLPSASRIVSDYNLLGRSFCASDTGDKNHISGNRIDIWLPKPEDAKDWGRRKVQISWWYNPAKKCYKNSANCDEGPPAGGFSNIDASGLKFAFGNEAQIKDASIELGNMLDYVKSNAPNAWVINSISDSEGMVKCSGNNWPGKPPCAHAQYSCHYGGKNCAGASYAFDLEATGPNDKQALAVALTACQWGKANNIPVLAVYEEPSHIHISVKGAECDCDSKGERSGNICN